MPNNTTDTKVDELIINTLTKAQYDDLVANNQVEADQLYLTKDEDYYMQIAITYGTTTYAQITSALGTKQEPVCNYNSYQYIYAGNDGTYYYFTCAINNEIKYVRVNSTNTWSNGTASLQTTISDLGTIRANASLGASAVQPSDLATVAMTGDYDDLINKPTITSGTVTSVRVQATSPVQSSTSTAQSTSLNTTISLADAYGDTKNPYGTKTAKYVLAGPTSGSAAAPTFRALEKTDIPLTSETATSGGTTTSLVTTGEKYTWNNKQDALATQTAYTSKGSATKVPQITTNTLGQVTGITEVTITQPTVNNKTITIQKNSTTVDSFTLNQSSNKTINITVPTTAADIGAVASNTAITGATKCKITYDSKGLVTAGENLSASDIPDLSATYLTSHQSIKSIKSDNTTAQSTSSSETVAGSGTINLHKVSKTGSYNDLLNKPTIPTVNNNTITIQKNSSTVDSFTLNQSSNKTINITVPTKTSDLTNDSGYTTNTGTVTSVQVQAGTGLTSSTSTAQTTTLNTTIGVDANYKLPTTTEWNGKQDTISDLGYIRNKAALVDDKISGVDITDSGNSLPSASGYNLNDTFLNKTDKKLYKTLAPAYALNSSVYKSDAITVDLTTGLATGFSTISSPGGTWTTCMSNSYNTSIATAPIYVHFKTGSTLPTYNQYIFINYTPVSYYSSYFGVVGSTTLSLVCNHYITSTGQIESVFNYPLFDTVLEANTEYYLYLEYNNGEYIATLSSTGYNINIIETSSIEESTTPGCTTFYYGGPNNRYATFNGMSVYLLDSSGNFLVADGALTWDSGTALENNTQYNDTTNEKTIYYNNDIIYEGGSVAVDSSTITLNSSNQIQTVGYKDVRTSNTLKTWTGTRAQYDAIVTKDANTLYNITDDIDTTAAMLELLYPVGAVYIGTMDVCPLATLGIGSWEQQTARFLVEKKEATSNDPSWYNLYSDGWCEQGGKVTTSASSGAASTATITFSKPFIDLNYEFHTDQSTNAEDTAIYTSAISSGRSTSSLTISSKYINVNFGAAGQVTYRWNCSYYTSITSDLKMWRRIS